jgi:hypothetical protein
MFILVEETAEAVVSSYVEVGDLLGVGVWVGEWVQWAGVRDSLVGPVFVVEGLELAQCVHEMAMVPDQGAVQQLAAAGLHPAQI